MPTVSVNETEFKIKDHCDDCAHNDWCPKMAGIPYCYGIAGEPSIEIKKQLEAHEKINPAPLK